MTDMYGFELVQERFIPELNTRARIFRHLSTGAELLSLENDDENKVFGITFRTPPNDSTGVAHILEHAVFCGSRKYPLKEPFVELLKSSLQTFLNAFTFPDKTCYPVASTNLQDLYNLIDVYLDAVFYPRISPHIFQQEGWHYELDRPEDALIYKGVVFNEMKGAYSSPDQVLSIRAQQSLFPESTYGVESGGNPQHIPNLTYEQFRAFHRAYYHPSNARIFFYGDDPPEERLRLLDAYLRDFERQEIDSSVRPQPRFAAPRQVTGSYAIGPGGDGARKGMLTINWMFDEALEAQTILALHILEHILIGTPASPLRKALIDSGLGEDLAGVGLRDGLRQNYFSIGLKGIAVEQAPTVEELILRTLAELATHGIDRATVEAALNTVEFQLRENNTGSYPRGLAIMLRSLSTWLHGGDPLALLAFETPMLAIQSHIAAGELYFERLIARFFLENPHRTTLILRPDPEQTRREAEAERARLDRERSAMSEDDLRDLVENTRYLKQLQVTPDPAEALASIPSLTIADLDRRAKTIPIEVIDRGGARLLAHDLFTNRIVYLDVGMDLRALPQELLPFVPLFGRALLEMGAGNDDFVRLSQRIGRATGGIWPQTFNAMPRTARHGVSWLFLRSKVMPAHADDLLAILRDLLLAPWLDHQERFRQIVLEEKASQEAALVPRGHQFVNMRLRSRFDEANWAAEQMGGVSYLFFLRQLARRIDEDWPSVLGALERIRAALVNRGAMLFNLTTDAENQARFIPLLDEFLAALPTAPITHATWAPSAGPAAEGLIMPAQVNYVGKGADLYRLGYQLHGSALVISRYLRTTWLWERVRVQGGAYGGFCVFDHRSGLLSFLSYRDPNLFATLDVFDRTGAFLREAELSKSELTRGIIGAIGDLDAYQLPDARGYTSMLRYLTGETDELRQRMRDEVLATSAADFRAFADLLDQLGEHGRVVVLGSEGAITAANAEHGGWLEVLKVL